MKWRDDALDATVHVHFLHRDASGEGSRIMTGDHITDIGHSFLTLADRGDGETMIPFHRVFRIEQNGRALWTRT